MITNIGSTILSSALAEKVTITRVTSSGSYVKGRWVVSQAVPDIVEVKAVVSNITPKKLQFIEGGGSANSEDYREIHTSYPLQMDSERRQTKADTVTINTMYGEVTFKIISVVDRQQQGFSVGIGVIVDG